MTKDPRVPIPDRERYQQPNPKRFVLSSRYNTNKRENVLRTEK